MARLTLLLTVFLATTLAACSPMVPDTTPGEIITPITGTFSVTMITIQVGKITPLPPDYTPPPLPISPTLTPLPTLQGGIGPTELKYRVLAQFPDMFFCDPDFYPVPRANEADLALQRFPELQSNPEEFNTILAHNQLAILSPYTDDQKLLIYREHKRLAGVYFVLVNNTYQFQIQILKTQGQGELITGTIDGQGNVTVHQREPTIATCPVCLAEGTLIETPVGPILVQNLRVGMLVWTKDGAGVRVAKPIVQIGKTVVPSSHQVVHLVLDDGRDLWVSPGHPTADGRRVGQLLAGDHLDGRKILSASLVRYVGYATYDLLPAGDTGFYWANGVLLASTLKGSRR